MNYIKTFMEQEKNKPSVEVQEYPNGVKMINKAKIKYSLLHSFYKPLNDIQIDDLQNEVNTAQQADYVFPDWYRSFLKMTNGFSVFYGALSCLGEQTPLIETDKGVMRALIERDNPNWMAPFNLRHPRATKLDLNARKRWLNIGSYHSDGTQVAYDFKTNKIIAMYTLPVTMSIKELKQKKEADFEKLILAEWKDFETFFESETKRLLIVFKEYSTNKEESITFWKKTLPIGHKDFED